MEIHERLSAIHTMLTVMSQHNVHPEVKKKAQKKISEMIDGIKPVSKSASKPVKGQLTSKK